MDFPFPTTRFAVTGGSGFLGSHVVEELHRVGARPENVTVVRSRDFDLRHKSACRRLYTELRPDVVIHLAAVVGGIGANRENPGRFLYENLVMGTEMIEEARVYGALRKFVAIGTVCAYPKHTPVPFRETDLWNGYPEETNAPYGLAKKMMLAQLQAYEEQYGSKGIFLLPVNLYGPRDNFDRRSSHVIPALIRKIDEAMRRGDEEVPLWGDGTPTREFLHVRDAARGIVLAAARLEEAVPVNLGSGEEISIADLAAEIGRQAGFQGRFTFDTSKPNGQPRRRLDVSRARELFGFETEVPFAEGLAETVAWWRENREQVLAAEAAEEETEAGAAAAAH